jgi:hypothetical protein
MKKEIRFGRLPILAMCMNPVPHSKRRINRSLRKGNMHVNQRQQTTLLLGRIAHRGNNGVEAIKRVTLQRPDLP